MVCNLEELGMKVSTVVTVTLVTGVTPPNLSPFGTIPYPDSEPWPLGPPYRSAGENRNYTQSWKAGQEAMWSSCPSLLLSGGGLAAGQREDSLRALS